MTPPRLVIAGTNSGSGKTTLVTALAAALSARGMEVQPFKAGPDYIDGGYHTAASGRCGRNLDTMLLPRDRLLELFSRSAPREGISVIEGVMGLFDGAGPRDERGSTSHLAKTLSAPVILAINGKGMGRSAAALAAGFSRFDPALLVKGVVFNCLGSERHYRLLKEAVEGDTGIPVLGYLPRLESLALPERRMGLIPASGSKEAEVVAANLGRLAEEHLDIPGLLTAARSAPPPPSFEPSLFTLTPAGRAVIAVAMDGAFQFYYRDNLDILEHLGAELKFFSPLADPALPPGTCGIYLGGGFPEDHGPALADNVSLRREIKSAAEDGMPIFGEGGGLMYLAERLADGRGEIYPMAGVFPGTAAMSDKRQGLGYCSGRLERDALPGKEGAELRGRLFHYSLYDREENDPLLTLALEKNGILFRDGPSVKNAFASYLHLHFGTDPSPAVRFIQAAALYGKK